jgi:RNA methyltransferase, TrmH family
MQTHPESVQEILCSGDCDRMRRFGKPMTLLSAKQMDAVTVSRTPQGVAAVVGMPPQVYDAQLPSRAGRRVLLLDDVQDPGNVGALVRTAAALGFDGVLLSEGCADPFSPKCVQSSAGTVLSLWIRRSSACSRMVDDLRGKGFRLIAADASGEPMSGPSPDVPFVLALGNEGNGLSARYIKSADQVLAIPIEKSRAESLNVAVAGGICMFLLTR